MGRPSPPPHPGAALQPRPHARAGRERAGDTERARKKYRRPPPGARAGRPRRDTPPPPPPHQPASRGGPGSHPPRQGGWAPPAREGSRSVTRPPAPAAGSHGGREEQAGPRLRTGTPHRSYPEKPGEHEPEWYGGPRPPWTAQHQWRPLCCRPREGRGTEQGRATPRPTGPAPAAQPEETAHAPPPPSVPPSIRTPWTRPAARSPHRDRAGPPHPHARAHNADPDSPPSGRAVGAGGAQDPRRPTQRSKAPPRGRPTAAPTTPSQVGGNRDRTAPPPKHARRSKGPGQDTRRGTDHVERPYQRPVPGPREMRAPHHPAGGGSGHRESASEHTRKGDAGTTGWATGPSARNAQTAWNGVPASEGKGHPDGTARHTQRGTRGAGRGKRQRHDARCRPKPPRTGREHRAHTDGALRPPRE